MSLRSSFHNAAKLGKRSPFHGYLDNSPLRSSISEQKRPYAKKATTTQEPEPVKADTSTPAEPLPPRPSMRNFSTLRRPLFKTFLVAMATYQVLFFMWEKFRLAEAMDDKQGQLNTLREHVNVMRAEQDAAKAD